MWLRRVSWRRLKNTRAVKAKHSSKRTGLAAYVKKHRPQEIGGRWGRRRDRRKQESAVKMSYMKGRYCKLLRLALLWLCDYRASTSCLGWRVEEIAPSFQALPLLWGSLASGRLVEEKWEYRSACHHDIPTHTTGWWNWALHLACLFSPCWRHGAEGLVGRSGGIRCCCSLVCSLK